VKSCRESRFVIGPNASLSERGAWAFMGLCSVVALGIAVWFVIHGLWMILPFAGLELAALGAALWVAQRRNRYREVVEFRESSVAVEFGVLGRGAGTRLEFPRAWVRCELERGRWRHEPGRLRLGCSGQWIEIGRCLTDDEREELALRFRELLRPATRSVAEATEIEGQAADSRV
jgi:uncharacterized membrane protein